VLRYPAFPADEWVDMKAGILILTDTGALAHCEDPAEPMFLTRELQK